MSDERELSFEEFARALGLDDDALLDDIDGIPFDEFEDAMSDEDDE